MAGDEVYWTPPGSDIRFLYFVIPGRAITATPGSSQKEMEESNLPIRPAFEVSRCSTFCSGHNQLYEQVIVTAPRFKKNGIDNNEQAQKLQHNVPRREQLATKCFGLHLGAV